MDVGVLVPRTRWLAAWGLVALLVAIFPANVYMATHEVISGGPAFVRDPSTAGRWARLLLQGIFVSWAWWYTRSMSGERTEYGSDR